ncbi:unnamed protein product, partial [Polarella glacialis]
MQALLEAKKPLVFHNGLLDLLHLYTNFVSDIPTDHHEFGQAWVAKFPLLFDTRNIAQEGQYNVLQHVGGLTLEELHRHLSGLHASQMPVRFERLGPLPAAGQAHGSSGYDAVLTAEVFVMEMELWLRSEVSESARKRHRKERLKEIEEELQPLDWQAIHERAAALGVSIFRGAVQGRMGGPGGARKKVGEIRADLVSVQYAKEVDEGRPAETSASEKKKKNNNNDNNNDNNNNNNDSNNNNSNNSSTSNNSHPAESCRKRPRAEESTSLLSAEALVSSKVCRRFHNRIAI